MFPDEMLHKMFEVAKDFCMSAGGDGDAFIVSEHWKDYAEKFAEYEKDKWFTTRDNHDDCVIFRNEQESVIFIDILLSSSAGDITIYIP